MEEALLWYEKAAEQGNSFAEYRLGKYYLTKPERTYEETKTGLKYIESSAKHGNQYAQYFLGKLLIMDDILYQDKEQAAYWFSKSAAQGNVYAGFYQKHLNDTPHPSVLLSVSTLLYHMGNIFRDNAVPTTGSVELQVGRKLRADEIEKRLALGHKVTDHEDPVNTQKQLQGNSMSMTMGW